MSLSYPHTLFPGTSALLMISLIPQDGEEGPFLLPVPFPILRPSCHKPVFTCWQEPSLSKAKPCVLCAWMALALPGPTGTVCLLGLVCLQFGLTTPRMTQPRWDEGPQRCHRGY